ncbi:MAG: 5-formyltetrahydrofolate cyclo-ligase [Porticoccaceae bacterium]
MADASIRKQLRSQRRSLSAEQQYILSEKITAILSVQPFFLRAKRLGIYLANDGEVDPSTIVGICQKSSKQCFLPVIHPLKTPRLHFARYRQNSQLIANRFGILEPSLRTTKMVPPWSLDLILMPLVGFDRRGNRLGMGGGFYDRTLAFTARGQHPAPQLVGLAYSFQELESISPQIWDIPVDHIITEQEIIGAQG